MAETRPDEVRLPPPNGGEPARTTHQTMVEEEYCQRFPVLANSQAITMHNWYMYAKAIVWREHARTPNGMKRILAQAAAIHISWHPHLATAVDGVMEERFRRHADDDFSRTVQRTGPFEEVALYLATIAPPGPQ